MNFIEQKKQIAENNERLQAVEKRLKAVVEMIQGHLNGVEVKR